MKEIIINLKEITQLLNWQVTTLIILFMVRKHLGLVFSGLQGLLNRTTKVVVDGKTVTLEAAAAIIKEQKEEIDQKNKEVKDTMKELDDYTQGAVQALPKSVITNNKEHIEPLFKSMGMKTLMDNDQVKNLQHPDDPGKGKWGGNSINKDRRITAVVLPIESNQHLFKIILTVTSINTAKPLSGKVTFHLHPTFVNATRVIETENGIAQLHLIAYGAFTVGVHTEDGANLELDLSEDRSFPEEFRKN